MIIALIVAGLIIVGALMFAGVAMDAPKPPYTEGTNVHMEGETQVIQIDAKGGYLPRKSVAKAGVPTIIRFNTEATFDCSASVRIPALNVSKILPQTGSTDIDIGSQSAGPLQGSCGMGMYPFEVIFE